MGGRDGRDGVIMGRKARRGARCFTDIVGVHRNTCPGNVRIEGPTKQGNKGGRRSEHGLTRAKSGDSTFLQREQLFHGLYIKAISAPLGYRSMPGGAPDETTMV